MRTTLVVAAVAVAAVAVAAVFGARGPGDPAEARAAETPWTFAAPMSQRRSYIAAAELDGHIYAAGGMVGETGRFLSVFQRFDPAPYPQRGAREFVPRLSVVDVLANLGEFVLQKGEEDGAPPGARRH